MACLHEMCRSQHLAHPSHSLAVIIQDHCRFRFRTWSRFSFHFRLPEPYPADSSASSTLGNVRGISIRKRHISPFCKVMWQISIVRHSGKYKTQLPVRESYIGTTVIMMHLCRCSLDFFFLKCSFFLVPFLSCTFALAFLHPLSDTLIPSSLEIR